MLVYTCIIYLSFK